MGGLALRVLDQSYSTLTNSLSLNHKYLQCFNAYVVMFLLLHHPHFLPLNPVLETEAL